MIRFIISIWACGIFVLNISADVYAENHSLPKAPVSVVSPARYAATYNFKNDAASPGIESPARLIPLGPTYSASSTTVIGTTKFDNQHYCSMGRQIEHRTSNYIHFIWTAKYDNSYGENREIKYRAYNLVDGYMYTGERVINRLSAGYAGIDADPAGCAVATGFEKYCIDSVLHDTIFRPYAYWEINSCSNAQPTATGTFFSEGPLDVYGWYLYNSVPNANENIWPKIEWDVDGINTILHMVATESGFFPDSARTISYYRRTGVYGGAGVWSGQRVIDTVMNPSVVIASSSNSDKVAIVWASPLQGTDISEWNQYENDIWYAIADDQGSVWASITTDASSHSIAYDIDYGGTGYTGGNITSYTKGSEWKAYCDISALFSSDSILHVVWGCRRWEDQNTMHRRHAAIFHWSDDNNTITEVVKAVYDTGGACYGYDWGGDVAKMSISECDGKLYVLYTQFGSSCYPCSDVSLNENILNGDLYLTASADSGLTWDKPSNLTNTPSILCDSGDCASEYWASMARYGRQVQPGPGYVLDILYINDKSPGSCLDTLSGIWTLNDVVWMETPCRQVNNEQQYDAFYFVHITDPHISWFIGPNIIPGARFRSARDQISSWDPPPDFVLCTGDLVSWGAGTSGKANLNLIKNLLYERNDTLFIDEGHTIPIYFCPGNHDGRYFHSFFPPYDFANYIDSIGPTYYEVRHKNLAIYSLNSGYDYWPCPDFPWCPGGWWVFSTPEGTGLDDSDVNQFIADLDALDGLDNDTDTSSLCKIVMTHHPYYNKDDDGVFWEYRPQFINACDDYDVDLVLCGHIHKKKSIPQPPGDHATEFVITPSIAYKQAYRKIYVCPDSQVVQVGPVKYFNSLLSGLFSCKAEVNIYDNNGHQTGPDTAIAWIPGSYYSDWVLNDTIDGDTINQTLTEVSLIKDAAIDYTFVITSLSDDPMSIELHSVDVSGAEEEAIYINLPVESASVCSLYAPGSVYDYELRMDLDGDGTIDQLFSPLAPGLFDRAGDANGDLALNVADAVYLINYIFKAGPPPTPYNSYNGDASPDDAVNIGDAVYLINYIFKGGPPPVTIYEWIAFFGYIH